MLTTELKKLKNGADFTWGEVVKIHEIGEYAIVEHHPPIFKNSRSTYQINYSKTEFSCYIDGNDICRGAESLDSALVTCIAYKYDGASSQAGNFFMKMIKPEKEDK